jgi:hypothetical protein
MLTVKARFMPFTVTLLVFLQNLIFFKQDCKNCGTDFEVNLLKKGENASVILGMSWMLRCSRRYMGWDDLVLLQ